MKNIEANSSLTDGHNGQWIRIMCSSLKNCTSFSVDHPHHQSWRLGVGERPSRVPWRHRQRFQLVFALPNHQPP